MIINAGIRRFVGHDEKGNIEEYYIDDWVKDWQTLEDISSGKELYKTEYTSADIKKMSSKKK